MKRLPDVLNARVEGEVAAYSLAITPDLCAFDGHYPGNPILPGVVQVDWAMRFARDAFANAAGPINWSAFAGVDQLKFHKIVTPGERLELLLEWNAAAGKLVFRYEADGKRMSAGTIRVAQ